MNKARRTALNELQDRITKAKERLDELRNIVAEFQEIRDGIDELTAEEQEYFDVMPESLQNGDRGNAASEAISQMEAAGNEIDELIIALDVDALEGYADAAFEAIEEAKGAA